MGARGARHHLERLAPDRGPRAPRRVGCRPSRREHQTRCPPLVPVLLRGGPMGPRRPLRRDPLLTGLRRGHRAVISPAPCRAPCRRSRSSTSSPIRRAATPPRRSATRWTWPATPSGWATAATGWPSTTTCPASPAPRPRWSSATSPAARRRIRVGVGRHHAAEPRAAGHRRAVRHARVALPRPHRPRPRPRARRRPAHRPRPAPGPRRRRGHVPPGRRRAAGLLPPARPGQRGARRPRRGRCDVPVWLLGSSTFGARLAAELGLPFAFASHFAPDYLHGGAGPVPRATSSRRSGSTGPTSMVGVNVVAADTDAEARRLFTSLQQAFLNLRRGQPGPLPPPVESMDGPGAPPSGAVERMPRVLGGRRRRRRCGGAGGVRRGDGGRRADPRRADLDHAARLRSYALLAEVRIDLPRGVPSPRAGRGRGAECSRGARDLRVLVRTLCPRNCYSPEWMVLQLTRLQRIAPACA